MSKIVGNMQEQAKGTPAQEKCFLSNKQPGVLFFDDCFISLFFPVYVSVSSIFVSQETGILKQRVFRMLRAPAPKRSVRSSCCIGAIMRLELLICASIKILALKGYFAIFLVLCWSPVLDIITSSKGLSLIEFQLVDGLR